MQRHLKNLTHALRKKDYLRLTLAIGIFMITTLLFAAIAGNVVTGGWFSLIDVQISNWMHERTTPALTIAALLITDMHTYDRISVMTLIVALFLIWQRRWYELLIAVLAVPGGILLNVLLKQLFQRARPVFDDPLFILDTYSFPSGHALNSTVFYGMLAALIFWNVINWRWRLAVLVVAGLMITLVAFTRVYLGAHYLSDVLAGILEGLAWLALCLIVVDILWRYRQRRSRNSQSVNRAVD